VSGAFLLWYDLATLKHTREKKMALFDTLQATTEMVQVGVERSQAESIAHSIAKVQGDTVTKDYLDLRLSEALQKNKTKKALNYYQQLTSRWGMRFSPEAEGNIRRLLNLSE
jgi:hypothetical protein